MKTIKNNQLVIGIIIGLFINTLIFNPNLAVYFELFQIVGYISVVLYFFNFSLIEFFIFNNKETSTLQILEINKNMRCLSITMINEDLLEGKELFQGIYNTIISNDEFRGFGYQKIIILSCVLEDYKEVNLHSNVLIDNDTPFTDYYNEISNDLTSYNNLEYGYNNLSIIRFTIKAWNCSNLNNLNIKITHNSITLARTMDSHTKFRADKLNSLSQINRSYSTKAKHWSKGLITPLSLVNKIGKLKLVNPAPIFVMDIETINFNNIQVPIAISSCGVNNGKLESKLF